MTDRIIFERHQRLRLRLRGHDREIAVDVTAVTPDDVWVRLAEPAIWLEDHHIESGMDLSFWSRGARHLVENAKVITFDLDRGRIQLARPDETTVVQRRKTFRETVEVPVRLISSDEETADLSGTTSDLGGGGLCVQASEQASITIDDELQLELRLPQHTVRARGRVRWLAPGEEDGTVKVGLAFTRIGEREQDWVYGFLFDLQRNRLRAS